MTSPVPQTTRFTWWFTAVAGAYALVGGWLTVLGWGADLPQLTDWDGDGISMQPNAALASIVTGIALLLLAVGRDKVAAGLGFVVAVIGGATLFEYVSGVNLGIDTLLMFDRPWGRVGTLAPGRMGPPGSISWTLAGIALMLTCRGAKARKAIPMLGLIVACIAGLSLIGYLFGANTLYTLPRLTTIALQTSTIIFAVGLGLIAVASDREPMRTLLEDSAVGALARRALPFIIMVPVLVGYLRLRGQEAGLYDVAMGTALLVLALIVILCAVLWWGVGVVRLREESLRRSERELSDFFDNASVGLHWVGPDGIILRVNQTELDLLGYRQEEYVGHHIAEFHVDRGVIDDILQRPGRRETIISYEARLRRKDGSHCYALINSNVLWDNGKFIYTRCFTRDITDQKIAEEALREADRRKDEFLATLAHELRNPLAPVKNSLEIMKRSNGDMKIINEAQATMARQVGHMVRLIEDLLDVSRITHNILELRKETIELAPVIHHSMEACRSMADSAGHEVIITMPDDPIYLDGDPIRLGQVFGNLLTNACKYTEPSGHILLTVERQGRDVIVKIKDTGVGISSGMLSNIFEMFTRVDGSLERTQSGLGIGLTLVKRIVEMHGGTVTARSEGLGQGSEFTVRLPILVDVQKYESTLESTHESISATPRRVLVVDDNHDSAVTLAMLLKLTGNQTQTAHDGEDAVAKAAEYKPDVILLDIGLPKMNGYDACRAIREEPWGKEIVIIALTGWGQDEDRRKSAEAGFDGHLIKPVDHAALIKLLDELHQTPA